MDNSVDSDDCDGQPDVPGLASTLKKGMFGKEYQATAAREGWADFVAALTFNDPTESSCRFHMVGTADIDLDDSTTFLDNGYDGPDVNLDPEFDSLKLISCQGVPLTAASCANWTNEWGVTACTDTSMASYITARDWLEDVVNGADPDGCTGPLEYRSTEFDWLRFWWDMRNSGTGQGIGTTKLINLLDNMNPRSWDPDDNAVMGFRNAVGVLAGGGL